MKSMKMEGGDYVCLGCGTKLDGATSLFSGEEEPMPGNISVCWYCSNVAVFTEKGLRPPTREERAEFAKVKKLQLAKQMIRQRITDPKAN